MEQAILQLIDKWLTTNTDKSKAKQDIISVIGWLTIINTQLQAILNGQALPPLPAGAPSWLPLMENLFTGVVLFIPTKFQAILETITTTLQTVLNDLTSQEVAAQAAKVVPPVPVPAPPPTPSGLISKVQDIARTALAIQPIKGAELNATGIIKIAEGLLADIAILFPKI